MGTQSLPSDHPSASPPGARGASDAASPDVIGGAIRVLVVDVGGTSVKILATGQTERRKFLSGPTMTPLTMVTGVKKLAREWPYNAVSIGYPGAVRNGRVVAEPHNLGPGWVGFHFAAAFGCPVKVINDAAMQALGSYRGGSMLFLGLGAGLGTALVVQGIVIPMEIGHLPYRKATFEDYLGVRGLRRLGEKRWAKHVTISVGHLTAAFQPDEVVLGGGNAKRLAEPPPGCCIGDNSNAFVGGFRLWESGREEGDGSSGRVQLDPPKKKTGQ